MRRNLLTSLKRKAPVLITQHGKPAAYLMPVDTFNDVERRLAILEGIGRGERGIEEGRVVSHAEARKRMARWLK
jgi:prevent-host-death family protein